ncbi:glycosyltransferase sypH [Vibrio ishigakensis]|uniref:Glycosyltransferase sypH n=1 Tax=Vibrio ishigakensis TaxID=1481914 RepID=A0A0B8Q6N1_9VIBR|nr:glycosyltransferase sypH [Vibrio ishigakensis]
MLITSRYEGLPMTALEAMAHGIPVASLDVGDMNKLVKHKQNGFVVSDLEELANCLSNWESLSNREKQEIKAAARDTIEQEYSANAVIPELLNHYHLKVDSQFENQSI